MKISLLCLLLLTGCATIGQTKEALCAKDEPPRVDLAVLVAAELAKKPVVYVETSPASKRVIQLCKRELPGAYDDSALEEAVRVLRANNAVIDDCANKQLRDIAKEYGLEIHE